MVLMRTAVLDGAEALGIANAECARLHNEKAFAHVEHGGQLRPPAEGRSRTRKGKSGQKKQPQRGLGVAQLEKLRMQEQSKQAAACRASLQSLPSFGFIGQNQNDGACFRHIKGAIPHHHNYGRSCSLPFGNGHLGSPDKLGDYLAREGRRQSGKGDVDEDVFQTPVSLASTDHISSARHIGGPSVSIMLPRRKDDSERFFVCHDPQAAMLRNKVHGSPSNVNNPGIEASPARGASCSLACDASSPSNCVRKLSFFSSALVSEASPTDSHASSVEVGDENPALAEAGLDTSMESVTRVFSSVSSKGIVEVGAINAKLLPVVVNTNAGAPIFTFTNLQCFKSSLGPANLDRLPRDCTSVPVVGVGANCDRPKELSSFQSFLSNQSLSTPEKSCGWKRPWQALHESTCILMHSESLDLNALAGDIDAPNRFRDSAAVANGEHIADGAYDSEGIIRSASEDCSCRPLKIRLCGTWDENRSSEGVRDMGLYSDESLLKDRCAPEAKHKNRCLSDFPPSSLTLNRRRCLSSPEIPLLTRSIHQKSGDFLTLGLSSFPASPEVDNQEAVIPEERCKTKQADIRSKETHDILQLQMCNPEQVQQMGSHSSFVINEVVCSEGPRAHGRPSFRFFPLSSGSVTEHCHKQTGRKKEEFLDLRLKLAL